MPGVASVTTKMWVNDAGEGRARKAIETSLGKLGLDYVDLFLIHQPYGDYYGSWRDLQVANAEGLARAIGVSNFYPDRLADIANNSGCVPAVNQIETHPFFQREDFRAYMESRGIVHESWGPFAEGKNGIFTNELIAAIGATYGKSNAQVVLRWMIQRGIVVIPKTVTRERMIQNFEVFDFELSAEDMALMSTLDGGSSVFLDHQSAQVADRMSGR